MEIIENPTKSVKKILRKSSSEDFLYEKYVAQLLRN